MDEVYIYIFGPPLACWLVGVVLYSIYACLRHYCCKKDRPEVYCSKVYRV